MSIDTPTWSPLTLSQVQQRFHGFPAPWWIAGAWAVDLFVGHQTATHDTVEVGIFRADQEHIRSLLHGWELWVVDRPGTLHRWERFEWLGIGLRELWCRPDPGTPWRMLIQLNESSRRRWVFGENSSISLPWRALVEHTPDGMPFLVPQAALLIEAGRDRPDSDQAFHAALPELGRAARAWLARALSATHPGHPWLAALR